jgi:uncharacterized DUF497 family protein
VKFEWDESKNRANIRKHGFDLGDAEEMFRGPLFVDPDTREDYGESAGLESARFAAALCMWSLRNGARRPFGSSP